MDEIAFPLVFCLTHMANGSTWTDEEFWQLDPGDARLNRRVRSMTERMAAPQRPACRRHVMAGAERWPRTVFSTISALTGGRSWSRTRSKWNKGRRGSGGVVAAEFNRAGLQRQQARHLRPFSYEARRGMYVHSTYAVTTREPPGKWMWARARFLLIKTHIPIQHRSTIKLIHH